MHCCVLKLIYKDYMFINIYLCGVRVGDGTNMRYELKYVIFLWQVGADFIASSYYYV